MLSSIKIKKNYTMISLSNLISPNSVGVEVTQERGDDGQLGAAETIYHATQLLAVLHLDVLVHLHVEQSG